MFGGIGIFGSGTEARSELIGWEHGQVLHLELGYDGVDVSIEANVNPSESLKEHSSDRHTFVRFDFYLYAK